MKISLNWLNDYIDLTDLSTEKIVDLLTNCGLEVEEYFDGREIYKNFVVGLIEEKREHPNADKLSLCVVSDGAKQYNVVCGAPNVDKGQKVAFARIGAVIPSNGVKLKSVKIRGELSEGMICAEDELGLSDDHSGIMILDEKLKVGSDLSAALGLDDIQMEVAVTPNRADALSHLGVARDLSAVLNRPLILPELNLKETEEKSEDLASVEILNAGHCPRYIGKVVLDVEIKESPDWLKKKLTAIGLRPINNIVDATNFVLHEVGQPLHAFDLDRLEGGKIIVKDAGENDKFVTLDSKLRNLRADDLMICDAEKQVAIAGVMGGENSEVTNDTRNLLIESAYFSPSSIRRTSKHLGLSTDASYRFERGCNPDITLWAARRAAQIISEISGGKIAAGEIDVYPVKPEKKRTAIRYSRISRLLGYEVKPDRVKSILNSLEFKLLKEENDRLIFEVPLFRPDIEREVDLIEEVARIDGYNHIPEVERVAVPLDEKVDESYFNDNLRNLFTSLGFREIITNSLLNASTAEKFGNSISILNPQSSEMSNIRPSLLPGLLTTISRNIKVKERNLKLFEIGKSFIKTSAGDIKSFDDFTEDESLLLALTGKSSESNWYAEDRNYDIYDLSGIIDGLFDKMNIGENSKTEFIRDTDIIEYGFTKHAGGKKIGYGGRLKEEVLEYFDIDQEVYVFNFDIGHLKNVESKKAEFKPLLKFPKVIRDFAFILDDNILMDEVVEIILKSSSKLLKNISLFDIFQSESLGSGKKSLAFQLEFYDETRTLTEEEVDKDFWNAIDAVKKTFNAQLRG